MLHVPQVSTWGRYCLHFAAAALETHGRRETASPLPGAHVAADIRGAAPGRMSAPPPLAVVCGDKRRASWKKNFSPRHADRCGSFMCCWSASLGLCTREKKRPSCLERSFSGLWFLRFSTERSFRISAQCCWKIFFFFFFFFFFCGLHLLGFSLFFFPPLPLFLSTISQNLNSSSKKIVQPQREHGDIQITRWESKSCLVLHLFWETLLFPVYCKWNARTLKKTCSCD